MNSKLRIPLCWKGVRDGRANRDLLDTAKLPPGDYTVRIIAEDFNGNEAQEGRDLLITVR